MRGSLTRSYAWLHTWSGVCFGLLLFAIFFTGTLAVFDRELTRWMHPGLHALPADAGSFDQAATALQRVAPEADSWWIEPPGTRMPVARLTWYQGDQEHIRYLDTASGRAIEGGGASEGGRFFFKFHQSLYMGTAGHWIVGIAAMGMLVALVTGIVIHRRLFRDFFTFRPHGNAQRAWLDGHNVTSVLALPFHVLITYTGLVVFYLTYYPAGIDAVYGDDRARFYAEAFGSAPGEKTGVPAPLVSINALVADASRHWREPRGHIGVAVLRPGDAGAVVQVRHFPAQIARVNHTISYSGTTGEMITNHRNPGAAMYLQRWLAGLHFAQFGDSAIRWLYFLMGLAGSAMIGTGLVLWLRKRPRPGWIHGTTAAGTIGVVGASAAFLWANRLLPASLPARDLREMQAFFGIWALFLVHGLFRGGARRGWNEQLAAAAILCGGIPIVNALTVSDGHLAASVSRGDWSLAAVDLTSLGFAVALSSWALRGRGVAAAGLQVAPR